MGEDVPAGDRTEENSYPNLAEMIAESPVVDQVIGRIRDGRQKREEREFKSRLLKIGKNAIYDMVSLGSAGYAAYSAAGGNLRGALYSGLVCAATNAIKYRSLWKDVRPD